MVARKPTRRKVQTIFTYPFWVSLSPSLQHVLRTLETTLHAMDWWETELVFPYYLFTYLENLCPPYSLAHLLLGWIIISFWEKTSAKLELSSSTLPLSSVSSSSPCNSPSACFGHCRKQNIFCVALAFFTHFSSFCALAS